MKKTALTLFIILLLMGNFIFAPHSLYQSIMLNTNNPVEKAIQSNEVTNKNPGPEQQKNFKHLFQETFKSFYTVVSIKEKHVNIVVIGDSLTQGVGDQSGQGGFVGMIRQQLDEAEQITGFGKRGLRTEQLLKRLNEKEIQSAIQNANIIIVTIGANDIMKIVKDHFTSLTYETFVKEQKPYEKRLTAIFKKIRSLNPDGTIYLLGIFNPFKRFFGDIKELDQIVNDWNYIGQKVLHKYSNAVFIPTKDLFEKNSTNLFHSDNFHPNKEGYQLIARRVWRYLTSHSFQ